MAHTEVIHSVIALAALLTSASAVPMMPLSYGLMGMGGGLHGGHGNMMGPSHIGASYNDGASFNGQSSGTLIGPAQSPRVLNGVLRFFSEADDSLKDGISVIIQSTVPQEAETMGHHGGGIGLGSPFGFGKSLLGGYGGVGMYGGGLSHGLMGSMYGMGMGGGLFSPQEELEAVIDVVKPDDFVPTDALIVFTEPALTSSTALCPAGPVLEEPLDSKTNSGFGGLGTYAGAHNMLAGYGSPFGVGPMLGGGMEPSFGVIAKVPLKPGLNSFTVKGLGPFTDIRQLAGHGIAFCKNVQIGTDGRAGCTEAIFSCVQLSFTSNPERL